VNLEKRAATLASLAALVLVILALRLGYWQMLRTVDLLPAWLGPNRLASALAPGSALTDLNGLPQPLQQRSAQFLAGVTRGSIYDRTGALLAEDRTAPDGSRSRFYAEPAFAPILGYTSPYRTGLAGLELTYNDTLLGLDRPDASLAALLHQPVAGSSLDLTVDGDLQRSADRLLAGKAGAAIVIDAHTGAVLAMASAPRFDPNRILEDGYAAGLTAACGAAPTCQAPFLNRATQALYSPGSTFKTVTLIAGLDSGQLDPHQIFDFGAPQHSASGTYYVYHVTGGGTIVDYNHTQAQLDLAGAYAHSANAAFARIGDEMAPGVLIDTARRFGFSPLDGQSMPFELPTSTSQLANSLEELTGNNMLRASTAIGQGELLATPLDIARVALAVENNGSLPAPYLVESVLDPSGKIIRQHPGQHTQTGLMKAETAHTVRDMMIGVVKAGTGGNAAVPGAVVGGKTGTAQVGGTANAHAWFVGFAEGQTRSVVIVVVIENGGEGATAAAPIFAKLARQALGP
jgi:penicillin-binding protein A